MVKNRLELQELLESINQNDFVYFQPPASIRMKYPAIRYQLSDIRNLHADNLPYRRAHLYDVIMITRDPEDSRIEEISKLPHCRFDRSYFADDLNHYVFTLFY